jgi:hypothetical protein
MDLHPFRRAVEARDLDGLAALLAPDVVFHSPVTFKPYVGREDVRALLGIVMSVFEDFIYTDELTADGVEALIFRARVGDRRVEGIDILRFDQQGLIADFTVMVRPMSGVHALAEAVGAGLAAIGVNTAPSEG